MMQQSSGITGFWDPTSSHTLRPKPQFLSRQVYFDIDNDSPNSGDTNYTTNHFLKDLIGDAHGRHRRLSGERDPRSVAERGRRVARRIRPRPSHVLVRASAVDKKDPDALFVLENFGAFVAFTPIIQAFANHNREDLYLALHGDRLPPLGRRQGRQDELRSERQREDEPRVLHAGRLVSYEPLLAEAFPGDFFPALAALTTDTT